MIPGTLRTAGPTASALPARRELIAATVVTAIVAVLLLLLGPAPGDAPAHLYRTMLVRNGTFLWDNLWYAGNYPLTSYSLLYYLPAALVGNLPLVLGAAVASTCLFCSIAYREWGSSALWPCRAFGVLAAAPLFTGLYAYSVGFAAMLAALWAIQRRRLALALVLALLTFGFSPLAFVFLTLVVAAWWASQRRISRTTFVLAAGLAMVAALGAAVLFVFPSPGVYPFHPVDFGAVLATCIGGALLARGTRHARPLAVFFLLWGAASIFCFLVPTPVGDNVTRLSAFVFPLVLVATAARRFRPRRLCVLALAGALAYNIVPYLILVPYRLDSRPATHLYWAPAVSELQALSSPDYRVEVVPTAAHWEAWWLPKAGLPLARGWYRQLDMADYPVLFRHSLDARSYEQWLRSTGVRFVLLPDTKLDPKGGPAEASLIRSGATSLRVAAVTTTGTIYELPNPTGIVTGPAAVTVSSVGHSSLAGRVGAAGTYLVRLHWSPYWQSDPVGTCLRRTADGMIAMTLRHAGSFSLHFPDGVGSIVTAITGSAPTHRTCG